MTQPLIFAIPKGRILDEALPLLARAGIEPEADFHAKSSRALKFATNVPGLSIIRVRAFDVATGQELWKGDLPTSARSMPMTFRGPDGKQYVVISAGGHGLPVAPLGDSVIAFTLGP